MFKRISIFFAAALMLLAACQADIQEAIPDEINEIEEIAVEMVVAPDITATQESLTKTILEVDEKGLGTIFWRPSDEVNIFYGTTSTHYTSQNDVDATSATFTTTDVISPSDAASTNIWGLYPYNPSATCTGSAVKTTLPANQYGVPGTFDDDLFITVAHSTSTSLRFLNVCGGIKFSLSRDDIESITFRGNHYEEIAGEISITNVSAPPYMAPEYSIRSGYGENVITVTPKTGSTFLSDEWYYIILLPRTFSDGFTMTFTTTGGDVGTFNYSETAVIIMPSVFGRKKYIDAYSTLPSPSNKIYYTSTDGNVVSPNANAHFYNGDDEINIISNVYSNGIGIITLSGELTRMSYAFQLCGTLSSVTLPDHLSALNGYTFNRCTSLSSVILPKGLTSFSTCDFENCSALPSITIPYGVTGFAIRSFSSCTSLTSINIPESVYYLANYALRNCTSLASITIPNSVTIINDSVFYGCSSLLSITIPENVTKIGSNAFKNCTALTSVTVLPLVPPTSSSGGTMFDNTNDCPIYVPAGSVEAYKSAEFWSDYADRIQAIQ